MADEQTQQPDREEGAHERLNDLHARIGDAENWLKALQGRVQTIERALSREVGPALDIVETAAGFVSRAAGGTVGAVADVVGAVAEKVEAFVCPKHPDTPQTKNGCTATGCSFPGA